MTRLRISQFAKSTGECIETNAYNFEDMQSAIKLLLKIDSQMIKENISFQYTLTEIGDAE